MIFQESKIYKNEDALSTEYLPSSLPHRESQIELIARNLKSASFGRKPQNMFIIGPPGIGKTCVAKFVLKELEEFASEKVKAIYINTWDYNTSSALLSKITISVGYFVPRRGFSKDEIIEKLVEALKKSNRGLIICLDEVDQLVKKDEAALYDLLRLNQYVPNPIGMVMISNYRDVFVNIEPRIKSSLDIEEVEFKPYSLQEMKDILTERCKEAFRTGVLEDGVILLCANHAVTKGGDVRVGLECLRKAARICENENSNKIKVDYVKQILKDIKQVKLNIMKNNLKGIDKDIVSLLEGKGEIVVSQLLKEYAKKYGKIGTTTLREHINYLESTGIVKTRESREDTRGRKRYIKLTKRKSFK